MGDNRNMGYEYRSHIKAMIPSLALLFCVLVMGFILWNIAFSSIVYPLQREVEYIDGADYSYVIESSKEYVGYSCMKKVDNLVTFTNDKGKRLNVNTYIPVNKGAFGELHLREGEIAVSQKMADILGITKGSRVSAEYPIYDQSLEYEVRIILPYASDLYNASDNMDFSYVIVGDNGVLLNQAKGTWTYYLNALEFEEYSEREYSYVNRYDLAWERGRLFSWILLLYLVMAVSLLIFVIAIAVLMHREINGEVIKYYYDGYGISEVRKIDRRDHFFFFGIPCIIQIMWSGFNIRSADYSAVFFLTIIAMLVLMLFITLFVGGIKYGKAN